MKVVAYIEDRIYTFNSLEEASIYTKISVKRILNCIRTGQRWKMWTFDESL